MGEKLKKSNPTLHKIGLQGILSESTTSRVIISNGLSTTLQIFWFQKLQLLVVFTVQLRFGCKFCNYQLQLPIIAIFAAKGCKYCNHTNSRICNN